MQDSMKTKFHAGETAIQDRLGVSDKMARVSHHVIRGIMPPQHRAFFCSLPFAVLGLVDEFGRPHATLVAGAKEFITSPDEKTLAFEGQPVLVQEMDLHFHEGDKIGMLGIELETRRRNRMNGILDSVSADHFQIQVEQSFGNCPQYIQTRVLNEQNMKKVTSIDAAQLTRGVILSDDAASIIQSADTFFIASRSDAFTSDPKTGIDVSHRGGKPGFVCFSESGTIMFPDFSGNRFFNTLGNITLDSRVGLLFVDFQSSDILYVNGRATIHWDEAMIREVSGAERIIEVSIEEVVLGRGLFPFHTQFLSYSPVLERTGTWMSS